MSKNPFEDFIEFLTNKHGEEPWVTVYKREPINNTDHDGGMYCTLICKEKTERAMERPGWDLMIGSGGGFLYIIFRWRRNHNLLHQFRQ